LSNKNLQRKLPTVGTDLLVEWRLALFISEKLIEKKKSGLTKHIKKVVKLSIINFLPKSQEIFKIIIDGEVKT